MTRPTLPDAEQIALITQSYPRLLALKPSLTARFYQRLAMDFPDIFLLFKDAEPAGQQQKLLAAMTLLVTNLQQPALLQDYFQALGKRHRQYGVSDAMFQPFTETWMAVLAECLGSTDAAETLAAWRQLLAAVTAMMQKTPASSETDTQDAPDRMATENLMARIAGLLSQQQQLITDISLSASREPAAHPLLNDLATLRSLSLQLQAALEQLNLPR
jgi:hemoglobin-like flavoprotein